MVDAASSCCGSAAVSAKLCAMQSHLCCFSSSLDSMEGMSLSSSVAQLTILMIKSHAESHSWRLKGR